MVCIRSNERSCRVAVAFLLLAASLHSSASSVPLLGALSGLGSSVELTSTSQSADAWPLVRRGVPPSFIPRGNPQGNLHDNSRDSSHGEDPYANIRPPPWDPSLLTHPVPGQPPTVSVPAVVKSLNRINPAYQDSEPRQRQHASSNLVHGQSQYHIQPENSRFAPLFHVPRPPHYPLFDTSLLPEFTRPPQSPSSSPRPQRPAGQVSPLYSYMMATRRPVVPYHDAAYNVAGLYKVKACRPDKCVSGEIEDYANYVSPILGIISTHAGHRLYYVVQTEQQGLVKYHGSSPHSSRADSRSVSPVSSVSTLADANSYVQLIDPRPGAGVMVIRWNFRNYDTGILEGDQKAHASDILAAAYKAACARYLKKHPAAKCEPLRLIEHDNLTGHGGTYEAFDHAYSATRPSTRFGEQEVWRPGEPGFADIMDAPPGKTILHLLREHRHALGIRHITAVTLVRDGDSYWMRVEMDRYPHVADELRAISRSRLYVPKMTLPSKRRS